ncbi:MAG: response regulator [Treponema sp.]|nr:response regulator [Treponema sp.]
MALKVLIVDDSMVMRNTMKTILGHMKIACEFVEAADGTEALVRLAETKVELVLLDWDMPKLSGLEFLIKIRSVERFKALPIIMVTGKTEREHVIEAIQHGATDYVTKPVSQEVLIEKLLRLPLFKGYKPAG